MASRQSGPGATSPATPGVKPPWRCVPALSGQAGPAGGWSPNAAGKRLGQRPQEGNRGPKHPAKPALVAGQHRLLPVSRANSPNLFSLDGRRPPSTSRCEFPTLEAAIMDGAAGYFAVGFCRHRHGRPGHRGSSATAILRRRPCQGIVTQILHRAAEGRHRRS